MDARPGQFQNSLKKKLGAKEMCSTNLKKLQRNQSKLLREADTTSLIINRIHKHQTTFFGHVMRRQKLKHLVTIGMIDTAGKDSLKT